MNAKKKTLGLAAFGAKSAPGKPDVTTSVRQDVKPGTVACTVRLKQADWAKIQHLALDERTTFQALAVAGLDAELRRRGLPGFD